MTKEEAIKHFEGLQKRYTKQHNGRMCEAVGYALAALKSDDVKTAWGEGFETGKFHATMEARLEDMYEPRKPRHDGLFLYCADCDTLVNHRYFCPKCGRIVDWER